MKIRQIAIVSVITAFAMIFAARFCLANRDSSFAGHWEGKMNDLPGIDLQIDVSGGKISGQIVFYYQERADPSSPWQTKAEYPAKLLAPHVEGQILTFEAEHHKCHTCKELGPNAKFRMELVRPDEARLWNLEYEKQGKDVPPMKLLRMKHPEGSKR